MWFKKNIALQFLIFIAELWYQISFRFLSTSYIWFAKVRPISLNKKFCKWSHVWNTLSIDTCLKLIILTVRKWQQEETNNPTYHKLLTKQTHKVLQFIVSITVQTGADQSSGKYILRSIKIWNYDSGRAIITGYQPVRWL